MRVIISISLCLLTSCTIQKSNRGFKTMEFKGGQGGFQLKVPLNWEYYNQQGIDSYVGEIVTTQNDTLHFDLGRYSNSLSYPLYRGDNDQDESKYKSKVYWKKINGYNVKFACHRTESSSDYGVYFDSVWTINNSDDWRDKVKLTIYGFNLSKNTKQELRAAIKTVKFITVPN